MNVMDSVIDVWWLEPLLVISVMDVMDKSN